MKSIKLNKHLLTFDNKVDKCCSFCTNEEDNFRYTTYSISTVEKIFIVDSARMCTHCLNACKISLISNLYVKNIIRKFKDVGLGAASNYLDVGHIFNRRMLERSVRFSSFYGQAIINEFVVENPRIDEELSCETSQPTNPEYTFDMNDYRISSVDTFPPIIQPAPMQNAGTVTIQSTPTPNASVAYARRMGSPSFYSAPRQRTQAQPSTDSTSNTIRTSWVIDNPSNPINWDDDTFFRSYLSARPRIQTPPEENPTVER